MARRGRPRAPRGARAASRLAGGRPRAVRGVERRPARDGALPCDAHARRVGRDGAEAGAAALRRARLRPLGARGPRGQRRSSASSAFWRPTFEARFTPCVEVGWRLAFPYWGRGYATEAARDAIGFGFDEAGLDEIVSFTVPGEPPLDRSDGAARDALRRRVRASAAPARPPAAGTRPLPAPASGAAGSDGDCGGGGARSRPAGADLPPLRRARPGAYRERGRRLGRPGREARS